MILRGNHILKSLITLLYLILAPVILINNYLNLGPQGKNIFLVILSILIISFLAITYLLTWQEACDENNITIFKGFPIVTFSLFLFIEITDIILVYLYGANYIYQKHAPFQIVAFAKKNGSLRGILLVATIIQIMFLALINAVKNKIDRPEKLFKNETNITIITLYHVNSTLNSLYKILQAIINILLNFYKLATDYLKTILNIVFLLIVYIFRFLRNYSLEILRLTDKFIKVLFKTNYYFIRKYAFPLLLLILIVIQINKFVENVFDYINKGNLYLGNSIKIILLIFVETILLIWLTHRYKFIEVVNSVSASNIWVLFYSFVSVLISSWLLWMVSQFVNILPFKSVGNFTIFGTSILLLFILGTLFIKKRKHRI